MEAKPPTSAKSRRRSARKSGKAALDTSPLKAQDIHSNDTHSGVRPKRNKLDFNDSSLNNSSITDQNTILLGASLNEIQTSVKEKEPQKGVSQRPASTAKSKVKVEPTKEISSGAVNVTQRAESAKSRPKSSARGQSRQGTQSRAASSKGSRPASRTNSRIGSSRASSRIERLVALNQTSFVCVLCF